MLILIIVSNIILLKEDSLLFMNKDKIVDVWTIEYHEPITINSIVHHRRVKISDDGQYFFIYYSQYDTAWNHLSSEIKFYNVTGKMLLSETRQSDKIISFELTNIENNTIIMVEWSPSSEDPQLSVIKGKKIKIPIKKGDWKRVVSYDLSLNGQYLAVHVRNPYMNKLWDYIYFSNLKTGDSWQYLFPLCLSCKRTKINVAVDDNGQTDVEYKGEHRVFSKDGVFIDFYIGKITQ